MNPLQRLKDLANAFGFSGAGSEPAWFDASNPVCREAEKLLRAGRAAEAEEIFQKFLAEPRYAPTAKKQLPRILLALATAQVRQEKWDAADQSASRAWALLSEMRYRTTPEYAECCHLRALAAKGRGAPEDALRLYLQAVAALEGQKHPKPQEIVERRIEISALLREMGRPQEAERMSAEAVRFATETLDGVKHQGDALLEWALCLADCGRYAEAREAAEKAAEVHRAACGDHSEELAADYEKLGSICQKQEDLPAAVAYLEKALGIRERQVGGDTSEMALLMVALADLYSLIGRLAPALELLQQAVGKLGPSKDGNLAGALEKLGNVYVRTGRYEDAAGCFQRAFDFWAANPEDYADRILANREAYENLLPWLPEPAPPAAAPEMPDNGVSVLRATQPAGGAGAAAPDPAVLPPMAALPGPVPLDTGTAAAAGHLPATPAPVAGSGPGTGMPGPVSTPVPISAASAMTGSPAILAAGGSDAAMAAPVLPAGEQPGLAALHDALSPKQDAHGFCGWEELEFERLTR